MAAQQQMFYYTLERDTRPSLLRRRSLFFTRPELLQDEWVSFQMSEDAARQ